MRFFRETDLLRLVRRFLQSNVTHAPLSALLGEGRFLLFGVFAWSSAAVAAARWFCANTVWITLTARRMSAVMGYRCN